MANWCENILILRCNDPAQIQRAVKAYNKNRLLWEFFPAPNAVDSDSITDDWLQQNWGSGSDGGKDVGRDDDDGQSVKVSKTATLVSLSFLTRWTPPVKAMRALEAAGLSVELYYCDIGNFCGLYTTDGGDQCYDIPDTVAEVRETIPIAINEAFAIAEIVGEATGEEEEEEGMGTETNRWYAILDVILYPRKSSPLVYRPRKVRVNLSKCNDKSNRAAYIHEALSQAWDHFEKEPSSDLCRNATNSR